MDFPRPTREGAKRVLSLLLQPRVFVTLAGLLFAAIGMHSVLENARTPAGRKDFLEGDTGHYLSIAGDFARGDFSMAYVAARPHRQPLYPLLLAPVIHAAGVDLAALASDNVALVALTFLLIYFGLLHRLGSRGVAAAGGALFLLNPFIYAQATQHLLTEPLHVFLMMGILFALWEYLETRRPWSLVAAAALAGLDYLTRPNGLFVMMAMGAVVTLVEIRRIWRARKESRPLAPLRGLARFGLAALAFIVISGPSWVPRLRDFGNPIHHGYLSNYLWVDSYAEGHVGQRFAIHTAREYFATHGAADVAGRWLRGAWECGFAIPAKVERVPILFFLSLAGIGFVLWRGPESQRALLLFGCAQALPLVWTNLSNPTVRVPYASTLPFEILFAAIGLRGALQLLSFRPENAASTRSEGRLDGKLNTRFPSPAPRPERDEIHCCCADARARSSRDRTTSDTRRHR